MYLAKLAVLAIGIAVAAPAHDVDVSVNVEGEYTSEWGAVTLHQQGGRITGEYAYQHGQIDGALVGNVIRYAWTESDSHGNGIFVISTEGELIGTWGIGVDDTNGGGWRLRPTGRAGVSPTSRTPTTATIAH